MIENLYHFVVYFFGYNRGMEKITDILFAAALALALAASLLHYFDVLVK